VSGRLTLLGYEGDDDDDDYSSMIDGSPSLTPLTSRRHHELVRSLDSLQPQGGSDHRFSWFIVNF